MTTSLVTSLDSVPLWMVKKKWRQKPLRSFFSRSELENIRKTSVFRRIFSTNPDLIDEDEYESILDSVIADDQIDTLIRLTREKSIFTLDYEKEEISSVIQFFLKMLSRFYLSSDQICEILPLFNYYSLEDEDPFGVEHGLRALLLDILKENDEESYLPVISFLADEAQTSWISRYSPRSVRVGIDTGCSVLCHRYLDNIWLAALPKKYVDDSLKKAIERQKKVDVFFDLLIKGYQKEYNDVIVQCIVSHIEHQRKLDLVPYLKLIHDDQRISTDEYFKILFRFGVPIDNSLTNSLAHCSCCQRPIPVCKKERKTLKKKRRKELIVEIEKLFKTKQFERIFEKTTKYFTEFSDFGRKGNYLNQFLQYRYLSYLEVITKHRTRSELALIDFYNLHRQIKFDGRPEGEKLKKKLFENCKFLKKLDHYRSKIDKNFAKKIGETEKIDIFEEFLRPEKEYHTSRMRYTFNRYSKKIVFYQKNIGIASFSPLSQFSSNSVILSPKYLEKEVYLIDKFFTKGTFVIFTRSTSYSYPRKGQNFTVIRLMNEDFTETKFYHFITDSLKPKLESINSSIESFEVFVTLEKRVYVVAVTKCCLFFFDVLECKECGEEDYANPTNYCTFSICGYEFRDVKFFGGRIFASVGRGIVEYEFCEERKEANLKRGYVDVIEEEFLNPNYCGDKYDNPFYFGHGLKKIYVSRSFIVGVDLSKRDYGDEEACEYETYRGRIVLFSKKKNERGIPIAIHRLDEENRDGNLEIKAKIGRFLFFVYRVIGGEKKMMNDIVVVLDIEDGSVLEFECFLNHPIEQIHLIGENHHRNRSTIRVLFVGLVGNQYIYSSLYDLVFFHKVDKVFVKDEKRSSSFVCNFCSFVSKEKLSRCSGCKTVVYCSRKCQKRDWKRHKKECTRFKK